MSRRAVFRNEVKTRLRDRVYDALQVYKELNGIDSDSAALNRVVEVALLGVVGTLPAKLIGISADLGQVETRAQA